MTKLPTPKPQAKSKDHQPPQDKAAHLPKVAVGDRFVTQYDPVKALEIVEKLAGGATLNAICKGVPGMPAPSTFKRWVVNNPDLAKAFQAAIVMSASSLEEEALDAARLIAALPKDGTHVRAVEVKIGQLRWSAERRDAAKFGTKTQLNLKVPVQIITSLNLNAEADTLPSESIYTLDLTPREAPLVEEKRIKLGGSSPGPRKRVLTPRQPGIAGNPFTRIAQGLTHEDANVRPESHLLSHQSLPGAGEPGVPEPRTEEAPHQQEALNPGEAPAKYRQDK